MAVKARPTATELKSKLKRLEATYNVRLPENPSKLFVGLYGELHSRILEAEEILKVMLEHFPEVAETIKTEDRYTIHRDMQDLSDRISTCSSDISSASWALDYMV